MSIISSILEKLGFGTANASTQAAPDTPTAPTAGSAPPSSGTTSQATPEQLRAKLDELKSNNPDLNPQSSIVDLLKALGMESGIEHRRALAAELKINPYDGTAEQNIELHKAVLNKATQG